MAKIMLVEDDNNLREIYAARLTAEGYEIVSAQDGEEALATAVKEKPDLIISDVMMPKISGFDMLDILRTTPETKNTKVIMMTALSQVEDKQRADKLGADRYLVKSQVTLEDVAKVVKEVLEGTAVTNTPLDEPTAPLPTSTPVVQTPDPSSAISIAPDGSVSGGAAAPATEDPVPAPAAPVPADEPPVPPTPPDSPPADENAASEKIESFLAEGQVPVAAPTEVPAQETPEPASRETAAGMRVIQPITDPNAPSVSIDELLKREEEKEAMQSAAHAVIEKVEQDNTIPPVIMHQPMATEPTPPPMATPPTPGSTIDPRSISL